jgi:hypothetical protein
LVACRELLFEAGARRSFGAMGFCKQYHISWCYCSDRSFHAKHTVRIDSPSCALDAFTVKCFTVDALCSGLAMLSAGLCVLSWVDKVDFANEWDDVILLASRALTTFYRKKGQLESVKKNDFIAQNDPSTYRPCIRVATTFSSRALQIPFLQLASLLDQFQSFCIHTIQYP